MTTLPEANAKFAIDCFHRLTEEHPNVNVLFSPVNLTSALGLLALGSGSEQADGIRKVMHWNELEECPASRHQRQLGAVRSFARSATILKAEEVCPKPKPTPAPVKPRPEPTRPKTRPHPEPAQPEPTCPKPRPHLEPARPEPTRPKPRPRPEPAQPEPPCPKPTPRPEAPRPKPRPCPEPAQPPCPETDVPDYECETPKGVHTEFSKILATLHAPNTNYTLSFANKLYGDHAIAFAQKFMYCALKLYWTDVAGVDIQNAPEEVRRIINLWVEVQTHGKIKDLLPKDSFDCLAQLLQVNALYFKGQWQVRFDKELTVESPFYSHDAKEGDCPKVFLMNRKGVYNTATLDSCGVEVQVLQIPYKDTELSLIVVLPTDSSPEALQQLEDALIHEDVINLPSQLKPSEVDAFIPKFSFEKSIYAIDYLDLPNLKDPEKADFSQATTTEKVALTELVHDACIEINEEGGDEADAPPCPRDRRPRQEPVEFVANHPFLYYIWHNCTQSVIALGRFAKPE